MAIHYNGPISKTPDRVACALTASQAVTSEWHAADCGRCKTSLVGLVIEWTALGMPDRFVVAAVEPYRVGLSWSDSDEAEVEWHPLRDLDAYDIDADRPAWRAVL